MKKRKLVTLLIILGVILLSVFILTKPSSDVQKDLAECIGQNSIIYVQLGCHACETQEKMFGESYQYLNVVDCFFEREKCGEIKATPTWVINDEKYVSVQSLEELKMLTNC